RTRSTARLKLTAVGRAPRSSSHARARACGRGSRASSSATPYAAATPINGAPRIDRRRIASATCDALHRRSSCSRHGSAVWSSAHSASPSNRSAVTDEARPPRVTVIGCSYLPSLADTRIGQHVGRREGLAQRLENRDRPRGESARGHLGNTLHEEDHRVLRDRLLDLVPEGVRALVAHAVASVSEALVWMESAWMRSPTSSPNTSYTSRCWAILERPSNDGADTTALKWWPSPVTAALAPGIPASIRA